MNIYEALSKVIENEGGYVDNPSDHGGPTKYGITEATARRHGYAGDMKDLPVDKATAIYKEDYWTAPGFDKVNEINGDIALRLFDFGVNAGTHTSAETLQTALNALTNKVNAVDGNIGPLTLESLKAVLKRINGTNVLLGVIRALQIQHYLSIIERDESQYKFLFGWLSRCIK